MTLVFPAQYEVHGRSHGRPWVQRGNITVRAENGRMARLVAMEEIIRRCGLRPSKLDLGAPR